MKQVLITIDTEVGELGKNMADAFEIFIEGKISGREVGYKFIMDTLERYGIIGHFFVDVYPFKLFGEKKFKTLAQEISKKGHYVHLHTHPSTAFDNNRIHLNDYSLLEQIDILKFGAEKIREWTGKYPVAHRAGGYAIDKNTFKALERAQIFLDSSYFYKNENCEFIKDTINEPFEVGDIKEIPVTLFEEETDYQFLNLNVFKKHTFKKLDFRYGADIDEIKNVILNNDESIFIVFLHSFNFLNLPYNFRKKEYHKISVNNKLINEFENLVRWFSLQKNITFPSMQNISFDAYKKDNVVKIYRKKDILSKMADKFKDKILNIKNT